MDRGRGFGLFHGLCENEISYRILIEGKGELMDRPSILIVDDEDNVRSALARWFSLRGFDVEQAFDGVNALEKFEVGRFDVITMDLEMPRMDGLEALKQIRELDQAIPILVVTGFPRDAEIALKRGAAKVLHKPLHLNELESEVRQAMADAGT